MNQSCECLIIGQGIAGTLMAHELYDRGISFRVVDPSNEKSSSAIAAGIINPITGRRFVKSWRIDELLPFAQKRYAQIQKFLHCEQIFTPREILRVLFSVGEENEWWARTSQEGWQQYVKEANGLGEFEKAIFPGVGQGILKGAQVNVKSFIDASRQWLLEKGWIFEERFSTDEIDLSEKMFRGIRFDHLIFCEGVTAAKNALWEKIEFEPAKGEVFHLKIPGLQTKRLLKHKMMLAPMSDDLFWFGANYEWNADSEEPSDVGKQFLSKRLNKMIRNYEIVGHLAATRPTIKDRRPVLGEHPEIAGCHILNGLGTKGASLGPLLAKEFVDHLFGEAPILNEISISRFYK